MFRLLAKLMLGAGLIFSAVAVHAENPNLTQMNNSNAVWFANWTGLTNGLMVVVAPDQTISKVTAQSGTPVFKLTGTNVVDGIYRFELRAATDKEDTSKRNNQVQLSTGAEEDETRSAMLPYYQTGYFVVKRGIIIAPEKAEEEK